MFYIINVHIIVLFLVIVGIEVMLGRYRYNTLLFIKLYVHNSTIVGILCNKHVDS